MRREPNIDLRVEGRIHACTAAYRRARDRAVNAAINGFEVSKTPYLSLSGGKDSVAMLGVVESAAQLTGRDYTIWAHVSDASFPGTTDTIKECAIRVGRRLVIDKSPVSAFDVVGTGSTQRFGKKGYFFNAISRNSADHDLAFVGVRAAESKRRMAACRAHGTLFKSEVPVYHLKCQPISWFSIWDVAAAIHESGLPIHPIYDKHPTDIGCIRLSYITALDLIEKGTVVFLRRNYPKMFQRLCEAYPKARQFS